MKRGVLFFWGAIILIVLLAVGASFLGHTSGPGKYDTFAQCIKSKGVQFYGAFWCPHCQRTKAMFGPSAQYLPYIECSTPGGQGQTQICKDKGVQQYPTWMKPNATTTLTGEHTMQELSDFSGCPLPQ
jgi:hypothetical protein